MVDSGDVVHGCGWIHRLHYYTTGCIRYYINTSTPDVIDVQLTHFSDSGISVLARDAESVFILAADQTYEGRLIVD